MLVKLIMVFICKYLVTRVVTEIWNYKFVRKGFIFIRNICICVDETKCLLSCKVNAFVSC